MPPPKIVNLHSFTEVYQVLHAEERANNTCWIVKGIDYISGQVEVIKFLQSLNVTNPQETCSINTNTSTNSTNNNNNNNNDTPQEHLISSPFPSSPLPSSPAPSNFVSNTNFPVSNTNSPITHSNSPISPSKSLSSSKSPTNPLVSPSPPAFDWNTHDLNNFRFWGCKIPAGIFNTKL